MSNWRRFEKSSTKQLIEVFQNANSNIVDIEDSFLTLVFRFRKDVLNKCEILCRNLGHNIEVAYEITEITFEKYGKTKSFDLLKGSKSDLEDRFRFYLYKIASNALKDFYKKETKRKNGQLYNGNEGVVTEMPSLNIEKLDIEEQVIHNTLMSLPTNIRIVYLTYKAHEKNGVNLPRKLNSELREYLGGITQSTVRSYKKVAIDKIEDAKLIIKKLKGLK